MKKLDDVIGMTMNILFAPPARQRKGDYYDV